MFFDGGTVFASLHLVSHDTIIFVKPQDCVCIWWWGRDCLILIKSLYHA